MTAAGIHLLPNVIDRDYTKISRSAWQKVRGCGLQSLELGATSGPFPETLIELLRELDFTFLGHGSALWSLQQDLPMFIDRAHNRKESFILCYWPWLDGAERITRSQISASCAILQDLGRRCQQEKLRFAFHNHGIEFAQLDGTTICEHMLHETDPELVSLELDLYHMIKVGYDPAAFMARNAQRISILHLNAMDGLGDRALVGDGMSGFDALLALAPTAQLVIEGHNQKDPLRYVEDSYVRLKALSDS